MDEVVRHQTRSLRVFSEHGSYIAKPFREEPKHRGSRSGEAVLCCIGAGQAARPGFECRSWALNMGVINMLTPTAAMPTALGAKLY